MTSAYAAPLPADSPSTIGRRGVVLPYLVFALGSIAQGAPTVVVALALERRDAAPAWLSAAAVARILPYLVVAPLTGAVAARVDGRTIFRVVGILRALLIATLGVGVALRAPFAVLVAALAVLVAVGCPVYPALMRIVHHTTESGRARPAIVAAGVESAAFWAGPGVGGVLLGLGDSGALAICVVLCLVSAIAATAMPTVAGTAEGSRIRDLVGGAVDTMLAPGVRTAVAVVLGLNVLAGLVTTVLVRLPAQLGRDDEQRLFGLLSAANGAGALAAFVALLVCCRAARHPLVLLAAGSGAAVTLGVDLRLPAVVAACAVLGAAVMASEVVATTIVCRDVPRPLVAAAFGMLDAWMVAAMVVGSVAAPIVVATIGLRAGFVVAGISVPVVAIAMSLRRSRRVVVTPPSTRLVITIPATSDTTPTAPSDDPPAETDEPALLPATR